MNTYTHAQLGPVTPFRFNEHHESFLSVYYPTSLVFVIVGIAITTMMMVMITMVMVVMVGAKIVTP